MQFRVSQDLFSSFQVDVGTQFLLRSIWDLGPRQFSKVLDLGCGYGPIGLTLKKFNGAACVHMVDRDALAVEYSRQNVGLNCLSDVEVYGSLGYDDVRSRDFDLIASNIPAKAGPDVISHLLRDAVYYLRPGGVVVVVVVAQIERMVEEVLRNTSEISCLFKRSRRGHAIFGYQFTSDGGVGPLTEEDALQRGVYHRERTTVSVGVRRLPIETVWGLPEFESPSYRNELLIEYLMRRPRSEIDSAALFNPGQGHAAVVLAELLRPRSVHLIDRDLLALRCTKRNLVLNGFSAGSVTLTHQAGMDCTEGWPVQVFAGVVREDEGPRAAGSLLSHVAALLAPRGRLVLSASSTGITRIIEMAKPMKVFELRERKRWRGNSLVVFERR